MDIKKTGGPFMFELDPEDIVVLGEPAFSDIEPLTSAQALYTRAGSRAALNNDRELSLPPIHADTMVLRSNILRAGERLGAILRLTRPYLPAETESVAQQADAYLRSMPESGHGIE